MMRLIAPLVALFVLSGCGPDQTNSGWSLEDSASADEQPFPEAPDLPDDPTAPDVSDATDAWAGLWLIDQPSHALYEATIYDFRPDGTLVEVRSEFLGGGIDEPPEVGFVARCEKREIETRESCEPDGTCEQREYEYCAEWGPTCFFGERWSALSADEIYIQGECSDDQSRMLEFEFSGERYAPAVIRVEGEEWEHNSFEWRWSRCDDEESCLPEFVD